jgi:division protein CdvB (Snf7/Vps24/ESCRT-III family)
MLDEDMAKGATAMIIINQGGEIKKLQAQLDKANGIIECCENLECFNKLALSASEYNTLKVIKEYKEKYNGVSDE